MAMSPQELKNRIRGPIHLSMTPFDENEELDEKALRHCVRHVAESLAGEEAVFLVNGSTGEFYAMNDQECKRSARAVIEEVGGRFPVIIGTARAGTRYTGEMSQHAQEAGADGVMIVSPYYHLASGEELYRHFKRVADSIDIGIMVYNNPTTSKLWIPPELMARLSKIGNIVANKENTTNPMAYYAMHKALDPEEMVMVCGLGQMMYPYEVLFGCPGFVTELTNFAPRIAVDFHKAAMRRDFDALVSLMDLVAPFHEFISKLAERRGSCPTILSPIIASRDQYVYQAVCKEAMNLVGLPGGRARGPMLNLETEDRDELRGVLRGMGAL
ncbi:MAG: dihydrodipicolinate synthase family protein [Bryobacterales bacterium]|nr:dihydrodipicolinate synthase family protein [Bryobacterales bacterium]